MENVPEVVGTKNMIHFSEWLKKLESLGYKCYWDILNAKDFGVPQNRERCFMVSLLGDYYYEFPDKRKLEVLLDDLMEDEVDDKYFMSTKAIEGSLKTKFCSSKLENRLPKNGVCPTILARDYKAPKLVEITKGESQGNRIYDSNGLSVALCANGGGLGAKTGLYLTHKPKLSWIERKLIDTIDNNKGQVPSFADLYNARPINNGISCTLSTSCGNDCGCGSVTYINNSKVRKLTPRECFRLMGVSDHDFEKVCFGKTLPNGSLDKILKRTISRREWRNYWRIARKQIQSNASLYHLAGDSIVVNVLMLIFTNLLG